MINRNFVTIALAIIVTFIGVVVLIEWRSLFIPLALAVLIWFLLNALATKFQTISISNLKVPYWLCLLASVLVVALGLIVIAGIVVQTADDLSHKATLYQENAKKLLEKVADALGLKRVPALNDLVKHIEPTKWIGAIVKELSDLASGIGVALLFVVFLFVDQRLFKRKLEFVFPKEQTRDRVQKILSQIAVQIQKYLGIKTAMAFLNAVVVYIGLVLIGLELAPFWALLTFFAYFIPNIGGIIATVFPAAFAALQFGSWLPILLVIAVCAGSQFVIANLIEARLISKSLNMSAFVVVVALFVWALIWGIVGMILSVPILAIAIVILSNFESTRPIAAALSEDGEPGRSE